MKKTTFAAKFEILVAFKKPVIGFDIDDTLADLGPVLVSELNKRGYQVSHGDRDNAKWEMSSKKPIPSHVMNEIFDNLIASGDLAKIPTIANVKKILDECKAKGARIVLITARPEKLMGELTKKWLANQEIPYDALYFSKDKKTIADKEGVDLFVDDDIVNAFDDRVVILDKPWNKEWKGGKVNTLEQIQERVDKISQQPEVDKPLNVAIQKLRKVLAIGLAGPTIFILPKAVFGLGNSDYIAVTSSIQKAAGFIATQEDMIEKFLKENRQYIKDFDSDVDTAVENAQKACEEWVGRMLASWAKKFSTSQEVAEYYKNATGVETAFELPDESLWEFDRRTQELSLIYTPE